MAITLATIDTAVQNELRNAVNSPFSQNRRVEAYNRVIDYLQAKSNWNQTRRVAQFDFLDTEPEYSLSGDVGISDFKQFEDLRFVEDNLVNARKEFEEIDTADFSIAERQKNFNNYINFEERAGTQIMRVLANVGRGKTTVDGMDDLTTGRTWASDTTNSDATTLAADTNRGKSGSSLKFNIDVSQSANDYAFIETTTTLTTALDLDKLENFGYFRFWLGLHNLTSTQLGYISSVEFRWGNSSSVYWSKTVTTTSTGGSFIKGWNRLSFKWDGATETGTVDNTALDYFAIKVNYSSSMTDANNIRVDLIEAFEPSDAELVYFSSSMVNNGGTWQTHFSTSTIDTTEILLLPDRQLNMFVKHCAKELFPQKQMNSSDYNKVKEECDEMLKLAIQQDGNSITRERRVFEVDGYSNGRIEESMW